MNHQYDFEEQLISEKVPLINVPNFQPLITSRRRVGQLNKQTLKNIELYLQQSKNRQAERVKQLQAKQKFISDEVMKQQLKKQKKIKGIQEEQKQKLLKQCTFKPNINTKGSRRNLDEFLQNQNDHLRKIQAKKRNLKMAMENQKEKQTYKPKINPNASKSRKTVVPIHQRLYALKDKQNVPANMQQLNFENTFRPVISQKAKKLSRQAPIQQLLYGDALRRQQKTKDIIHSQSTHQQFQRPQRPVNLMNEKYAAQRFIREYFTVLQKLSINLSINYKIDYIMFNEVLKHMGFIKEDEESQDGISVNERVLLHDAYSIVEKFGVNARNVCVFLLGLIGIYHINPINFEEGQEADPEKEFNLDEIQGRKVQKHFDVLFRNRLNCQNFKKSSPQTIQPQSTFQPKINKKSQAMAQKYRSQMLQEANQLLQNYPELDYAIPEDGIISHTDLLVLHNMAKQIQRKKRKEQIQEKSLEGCTFKPTTLSSMQQTLKNSNVTNFDSKLGQKKSFELYNYYKSLQSKKESLQASREVDFSQCTFVPNLKKDKVASSTPYAKQIDQTLFRMHKGRQEKEQKSNFLSRGQKLSKSRQTNQPSMPNTSRGRQHQTNYSQSQHQQQSPIPTLILDVNLGDKTDRIMLYPEDQNNLPEVAQQFALKHQLDNQSKQQLLEMLQQQLNNVLQRIQEQDEIQVTRGTRNQY